MIYSSINVQEYDQFLRDRNNLMDENNDLNESYANLTTDYGEDMVKILTTMTGQHEGTMIRLGR